MTVAGTWRDEVVAWRTARDFRVSATVAREQASRLPAPAIAALPLDVYAETRGAWPVLLSNRYRERMERLFTDTGTVVGG